MDLRVRAEMLELFTARYREIKSKKLKSKFIDQILPVWGGHRKSLIRALTRKRASPERRRTGRPRRYCDLTVRHLRQMWIYMGFPCGKRMRSGLPVWLEHYSCGENFKDRLRKMAPATIDRLLARARAEARRKNNSQTYPAKHLIKKLIPLRDPFWRATKPGYNESDTVVHCGDYIWGTFTHTVTLTDLFTGWTEGEAILGKDAKNTVQALEWIERRLPVLMMALYFDNGMEYVNHELVEHYKDRPEEVTVARGRSGRKNDQCHVEQKNNHFVRQLFGYDRIEDQHIVDLMNDIYRNEWRLLYNFFYPQMKLVSKDRIGSKIKRKYDAAKTPYQRLIESPDVPDETKEKLRKQKAGLNPIKLQATLQRKLQIVHEKIQEAERIRKTKS